MKKRWIYLLAALTLTVSMCIAEPLAGIAAALEADEDGFVARSCSLTVYPENPDKGETGGFGEDLASAGVVVDLYQVARAVKTPGNDAYEFEMMPGYNLKIPGNTGDAAQDLQLVAGWETLVQQAAAIALDEDAPGTPMEGSGALAGTKIEDLDAGLYLLVARGSNLTQIADYKTEIKQKDTLTGEETTKIVTVANSGEYTYAFLPQLVSLPTKPADANGVVSTANPGDWLYDITVNLKPEQLSRYGSLEIVKTLAEYETTGGIQESATFVFEVTGRMNDEIVYSNVESITFTAAGRESVVLDRIPAGAEVTVREVYSGSSYKLTVPGDRTATIAADGIVSVEFENEYDGRRPNGHGIKNQFVYDAEGGSWHWYSSPAQEAAGNQGEPQ